MKRQGKLFNKLKRKVSAFTLAMLILQPLLMVAITPAKTFAASEQIVLQPSSQDARVEEGNGNGYNTTLLEVRSAEDDNDRSYVQFDLTGALPEGSIVDEATLMLYMQTAPGASRVYGVHNVTSLWSEGTIDWATQPSSNETPTSVTGTGTIDGVWLSWDVTPDINGDTNFGWTIKDQTEDSPTGRTAQFRPKNYTDDSTVQPKLVINYSTKPTSKITTPEASTYYNEETWPGIISGTAETPLAEIDGVEVAVSDGTNYLDWDTETWASGVPTWTDAAIEDSSEGAAEWSLGFVPNKDGVFTFQSRATDSEGGQEGDDMIENVVYDTTAPEVTVDPLNTNDTTPTITGTYSDLAGEAEAETAGVLVEGSDSASIVVTIDDNDYNATLNEDGTWSADIITEVIPDAASVQEVEGLLDGVYDITVYAEDLAGNIFESIIAGVLTIDTVAPEKVSDLKAVAGDGKVDLSWKNPADTAGSGFAGVTIKRTGSDSGVLNVSLISGEAYTDTTAKNGVTYTYVVKAVDKAGNESGGVSVSATPSAPVAPAISAASTSRVTSAIATETFKPVTGGEVKAAETIKEDEKNEDKGSEIKETKKIPVWGIIFLLILAAIGGYLFYVQNPENKSKI